MDKHIEGLYLVFIGILIFIFSSSNYFTNEVTVYELSCLDFNKSLPNCKKTTLKPRVFRAFPDQQTIVSQVEGMPPISLNKCSVRDYKNWTCQLDTGFSEKNYIMTDGDLYESPISSFSLVVSKWRWWITRLLATI
jgi:hypothetical protein